MHQQMGSLVVPARAIAGPYPRLLRVAGDGAAGDGGSWGSRRASSSGHRVVATPAKLGRITSYAYPNSRRLAPQDHAPHGLSTPKSCLLQDAPVPIASSPSSLQLQDAPAAAIVSTASQPTDGLREDKYYEVEMRVRDDELDEYGVVNNAVYASYIHSGRDVLLENLGISVDYWTSTGNAMALSELILKYYAPLRRGDRFVVKLRLVKIKGVRMIVDHVIETLPDRRLVLEARATAVCLDKNYRPARVFPELSSKLLHFFSS